LVVAAIDGDTNTVIAGLGKGLDILIEKADVTACKAGADKKAGASGCVSDAEKKALRRALRLMGALLQYAETFSKEGTKDEAQSLNDRRPKTLESLTREMTDRTGRENDSIFSLGGSLRGVGGVRLDPSGAKPTILGPLSLPLGIGYQSAGHFHLE